MLGIPFDFTAKPVVAPPQPPRETIQVKAITPERDACEIRFPRVEGYRVELARERLFAAFDDDSTLELTPDVMGPSLARLTGEEQKAAKTTAFDLQWSAASRRKDGIQLAYTTWQDLQVHCVMGHQGGLAVPIREIESGLINPLKRHPDERPPARGCSRALENLTRRHRIRREGISMATVHLLSRLAVVASMQALSSLPANPAPPPKAAAPPVVSASREPDLARTVDRIDERLRARIRECDDRDFASSWGEGRKLVAAPIREIESELLTLLKRQPDELRIRSELAKLYGDWCVAPEPPSPDLFSILAGASDPVSLALALTQGESVTQSATQLLLAALALRPNSAALWLAAARRVQRTDWKVALTARAAQSLLGPDGPQGEDRTRLAAAVAEEELELEINWGLLDRATRRLALLPAEVRTLVESGAHGMAEAAVDGVRLEGWQRDLRLELALLRLAGGDAAGAAPLLTAGKPDAAAPAGAISRDYDTPPGGWSPYSRPHQISGDVDTAQEARLRWNWFQLLEAWRQPSPEDPFELLIEGLASSSSSYGRRLAAAELARRERYPAVAAFLEDLTAVDLRSELERGVFHQEPETVAPLPPAPAAGEITSLHAELTALANRMEESAREDREEAHAAIGPDPAAPTVARLLQAPPLRPFTERSMPPGIEPLDEKAMDRRYERALRGLKLPEGFRGVRTERRGQRVDVLATSFDLGGPEIWLIRSHDGGATWSRPLYTALYPGFPYRVRRASRVPLLAGDRLQVEVDYDAPAPDFRPPHWTHWFTQHKLLEAPLAALERDSDGDGLTDLAEQKLVTDPFDPDTDHDGIPDAEDPLPQIAAVSRATPATCAAAALAAALGITGEPRESAKAPPEHGRSGLLAGEPDFLAADRQLFVSLRPRHRVVVLTPEEMAQAEAKLGPYRYRQFDLFMIDRAGRRSFLLWSWWAEYQNWQGGILRVKEVDGEWLVEDKEEWTT